MTFDETPDPGEVVDLPSAQTEISEPKPSPPGRAHGFAISGMAASALIGIAAFFAFATVGWADGARRVVIGVFLFSILGFVTFASIAVFTAARDSLPARPRR